MKKIIAAAVASVIVLMQGIAVMGAEVTVNFEGKKMDFDVAPFIEEDRTLVPMRAIFEAAGANVSWDGDTRTVIAIYEANGAPKYIVLQIDNPMVFVNEEKYELDVPARIVGDRTFVPLRFVMETLGREVLWDEQTYTVDINAYDKKSVDVENKEDREHKKNYFLGRYDEINNSDYYENCITTVDIHDAAIKEYTAYDNLLNDIYAYLKNIKSSKEFEEIRESQRAWIEEKENAIAHAGEEFEGGSGAILEQDGTAVEYTRERCEYLISLID